MTEFNAKAARIKRPLPFWVDAFQRDTQDLSTEEIGAYMLLLSAMWSRESCDLPDDDKRLARVCRVTESKWKRGLGDVMRGFLVAENGAVFSKRLRKEAVYVEHSVKEQSDRKKGKSPSKSLKDNESTQSTDYPQNIRGESPEQPTQQPNNPTVKKERAKALLSSNDDVQAAYDAYNEIADRAGLAVAQKFTPARQSSLKKRLKEVGGLDGWIVALEKVEQSDFLTGRKPGNNGPFHADLDFILQQSSFTRLMEGFYDNRSASNQHSARNAGASRAVSNLRAGFQASAADDRSGDGAGPADYQLPF